MFCVSGTQIYTIVFIVASITKVSTAWTQKNRHREMVKHSEIGFRILIFKFKFEI